MRSWLPWILGLSAAIGQTPVPAGGSKPVGKVEPKPTARSTAEAPPRLGPRLDENGWPIGPSRQVGDDSAEPSPVGRGARAPQAVGSPGNDAASVRPAAPAGETVALASGLEPGSPLLPVYAAIGSVEQLRALGGITAWWRLTIHGAQGEPIGIREITHLADLAFAERDRLEFADGRVYGRSGPAVFAERQGMPWPTLNETAGQELALLGLHLRLPWVFADGTEFLVTGRETIKRGAERVLRISLRRRATVDPIGPALEPAPTDTFELWCDEATGRPREFVHTLAISGGQTRRLLLEDWQDVGGVQLPHRRIYVDDSRRQTTVLQLLRVEVGTAVSDRDFRIR